MADQQYCIMRMRRDMPKLLRLQRASVKLASWCSWRCPLFAFVLVLAAHGFSTPTWWQATSDALVALAVALLFCSSGLSLAAIALLVDRHHNWFERLGLVAGVAGGAALVMIGLIGAWALMSSSVGGS